MRRCFFQVSYEQAFESRHRLGEPQPPEFDENTLYGHINEDRGDSKIGALIVL